MIRSALRPRRVVASTVALRLTIPSSTSSPCDQFSPPLLDPSLIDGLVQGHVDPVLAELDPLTPARPNRGAAARATVDRLRFFRLPLRAFARILLPPLPRLLEDAHRPPRQAVPDDRGSR